ncbi:iron-sulfur cluster assembly protein [Paenibacillus anaericanus]|uniref:Iron-sulfur cluster assembly accessory protein n=1 Tax=Paenibacillus anaericanus TaxID=170367 RepID=A0A3S1DW28_9BACL|nr:iron-sulfur cluster assembly accessory protein [Paenibacillus anaericanus]MDQ0090706.1 iron-sulfur cluster assembly protein [Paenibacillus anaericanus]RUT48697.1 iron-sulfur cluster assembly accessory protein [Paenibacillus anaericanus]
MINISDSAMNRIKDMLDQEETPNMFLRLGVNPGGCSGFSYGMGLDDEESEEDVHLDVNGLKVVVDKESVRFLNGLEIDFQESGMSGGFTINNPNAVASCGCGQSFRMKNEEGKPEVCD